MVIASWQCPACKSGVGLKYVRERKQWSCENGHCYDVSKEGYVNLLLPQDKNSKTPGDNKDMVVARRAFLDSGAYLPLADAITTIIKNVAPSIVNSSNLAVLDAGCGEGYYSAYAQLKMQTSDLPIRLCGVDISKEAIKKVAKTYKFANYAVASTYKLPVLSDSQNLVLQVFAPSSEAEVSRVLAADGIWIVVGPGPSHLRELKEIVYQAPQAHTVDTVVPKNFALLEQKNLQFTVALPDENIRHNLLKMTPFYWRISAENKALLKNSLDNVTADFDIRIYQLQQ